MVDKIVKYFDLDKNEFKYVHKLIPLLVFEGLLYFVAIFLVNSIGLSVPTAMYISAVIIFGGYGYILYRFWKILQKPLT